jgi:hypothetical protein
MTNAASNEDQVLKIVYTVYPGETNGHVLLGEEVGPDESMKLLWIDNYSFEVDDEGDLILAPLLNNTLEAEYGLTVISPWKYKIEYYEADCVVSTPMPEKDLTLP